MKARLARILCGALLGFLAVGPALAQQPGPAKEDVIKKMMAVYKFDTMLDLMRVSDLVFKLKGSGPFTVFAPTDEAFNQMPKSELQYLENNRDAARRFVLSHVVRGRYTAQQAVRMGQLTSMNGTAIFTSEEGGRGRIDGSSFDITNVMATNGIVHGLNQVGTFSGKG